MRTRRLQFTVVAACLAGAGAFGLSACALLRAPAVQDGLVDLALADCVAIADATDVKGVAEFCKRGEDAYPIIRHLLGSKAAGSRRLVEVRAAAQRSARDGGADGGDAGGDAGMD